MSERVWKSTSEEMWTKSFTNDFTEKIETWARKAALLGVVAWELPTWPKWVAMRVSVAWVVDYSNIILAQYLDPSRPRSRTRPSQYEVSLDGVLNFDAKEKRDPDRKWCGLWNKWMRQSSDRFQDLVTFHLKFSSPCGRKAKVLQTPKCIQMSKKRNK